MREKNSSCETCTLNKECWVPSEGVIPNDIMFVGEAPGEREIQLGKPFVGNAGRMLVEIFQRLNINRSEVYITNSCMCRPPHNRTPSPLEVTCCRESLYAEIIKVNPKVIVALGRTAYSAVMNVGQFIVPTLEENHGYIYPVMIGEPRKLLYTYHPQACSYSIISKERCKDDLRRLPKILDLPRDMVIVDNRRGDTHGQVRQDRID